MMKQMKINIIILVITILLLSGCNGYVSQRYYESYNNGKLFESLEDKYKATYGKKWREYEEQVIVTSIEELKARPDYINVEKYQKQQTSSWDLNNPDRQSKEYCVYSISYYFPVNFWNLRFTTKQYVKKTIKDLNREGIEGNGMKYIHIISSGLGTPICSYFCIEITGKMIE